MEMHEKVAKETYSLVRVRAHRDCRAAFVPACEMVLKWMNGSPPSKNSSDQRRKYANPGAPADPGERRGGTETEAFLVELGNSPKLLLSVCVASTALVTRREPGQNFLSESRWTSSNATSYPRIRYLPDSTRQKGGNGVNVMLPVSARRACVGHARARFFYL